MRIQSTGGGGTHVTSLKRGKTRDQVAIGFSIAFDWLGRWRDISRPITEHSKAKPMQWQITFDTQLKIALTNSL